MELDSPPESNVRMATDILYAHEYENTQLMNMLEEVIVNANNSLLGHLQQFLKDMRELKTGLELSSIQLTDYGTVYIYMQMVSLDIVNFWEGQKRSSLNAFI